MATSSTNPGEEDENDEKNEEIDDPNSYESEEEYYENDDSDYDDEDHYYIGKYDQNIRSPFTLLFQHISFLFQLTKIKSANRYKE